MTDQPTPKELFAETRRLITEAEPKQCKVKVFAATILSEGAPFCARCLCGWMEAARDSLARYSTENSPTLFGITRSTWIDAEAFTIYLKDISFSMEDFDKLPAETRKEIFLEHLDILETTHKCDWATPLRNRNLI